MLYDFVKGFADMFTGFGMLVRPGIKRYVVMPLLLNFLFFIALLFVFKHYVLMLDDWLDAYLPLWLHWLHIILWILFYFSFLLFFVYSFISIANIVAAPFNALLAEKMAFQLRGKKNDKYTWRQALRDAPRAIGRQLAVLAYYLPRTILILILFFIPGVQLIAPIIWLLFNSWYVLLMYLDYSADNDRVSFSMMRQKAAAKRAHSLGLGMAMLLFGMVPVVNFFAIPAAVIAATIYWIDSLSHESLKEV